jgi:broad specificity phosphatase PhoE
MSPSQQIWLVRHGETEWSVSGAHTGRTDIPLTDAGRDRARGVRRILSGHSFALVLTSPLQRARETCALAGYGDVALLEPDLQEWDYGIFEGRKTSEIRKEYGDWSIWTTIVQNGESLPQVASRAERVIRTATNQDGDALLFAHGHIFRILAARWLDLPPDAGRLFFLDTAAVCVLGYEREQRVIRVWNRVDP